MDFKHIDINTPDCGVYQGYATKVRTLMSEAYAKKDNGYLAKSGRAYTEAKTANRKIELATFFPIGTMVFSKTKFGNHGRFYRVVSFTKAGYPKLDNGDVLKYMHDGHMHNAFTLAARTTSKSYGYDVKLYTFFM